MMPQSAQSDEHGKKRTHSTPLADFQRQLARGFDAQGFHQSAITHYRIALANERTLKDYTGAGDTLVLIGKDYEHLGQYVRAAKSYRQALAIARKTGDRHREVSALADWADNCLLQNDYKKASSLLHQSLQMAQAIRDHKSEAKAFRGLADLANLQDDYNQAMIYGQKGLSITQETHDQQNEGNLWAAVGTSHFLNSKYDQAIQEYNRSLGIAQSIQDRQMAGNALDYLGNSYNSKSDFSLALAFFKRSLAIERQVNDYDGIETVIGNSGNLLLLLGQYAQAVQHFRLALNMATAIHDDPGKCVWLNQLGQVDRYHSHYSDAIVHYQQAALIARKLHNNVGLGYSLENIGEAYWLLKKYDKATAFLQQALVIADKTGNQEIEQWALVNQGNVYLDEHRNHQAVDHFQKALTVARATGTKRAKGYCFYRLMLVEKEQTHPGLAIFYGKQAVNVWQEIRRDLAKLDLSTRKRFVIYRGDTYRQLAALLINQGRLSEAQQVLELLKEEELFTFLRGGETTGTAGLADLTPQEAAQEKAYALIADQIFKLGQKQQALRDKAKQGPLTPDDQTQMDANHAKLNTATHHLNHFFAQLVAAFSAPTKDNQTLQARLLAVKNAADLQSTLGDLHQQGQDVVILQTLVTPDYYIAIITTWLGQKPVQFPIKTGELNQKVADFQAALRDPHADPTGPAHALYKILIAPLEIDLTQARAKTLMWSLDGTLRYVPIAALYDGKHYLVERFDNEVFTLGSQTGFGQDARKAWTGLGLGVSLAHTGFIPLPAVPDELHGVIQGEGAPAGSGVVPGTVLLDPAFTQTAMTHALEQGRYNLVHIASHFALHPGDPDGSFLLLGDGGHLSLAQMADDHSLFYGVDLLSLSACDTATGGAGADGKEVDSLGTIAQQDGAKSVLASLWPVSDASTRELMETFYRWHETHAGVSKAAALQAAQLSLLHGGSGQPAGAVSQRGTQNRSALPAGKSLPPFAADPRAPYAHPFYWAPFILIGNWR